MKPEKLIIRLISLAVLASCELTPFEEDEKV